MNLKSINNGLLALLFIFTISSCGNRNLGTPTGIMVKPAANANINYGHKFKLETYMTYSSGQSKLLNSKKDIEFIVSGGEIHGDMVTVPHYPTSFGADSIYVTAKYNKKGLEFETSKGIPYNYKGDLKFDFNGEDGDEGEKGSKGSTAIISRDGNDGSDGEMGGTGENGHDIAVHVYKESSGIFKMRVMNVTTSQIFYFRTKDLGYALKFELMGGDGGVGGKGGKGSGGKDGKKTEKKDKDPGNGGNGGNGGIGGTGGNGGTLYVFIHPTADGIQKRIALYNSGGAGGKGGSGGSAGSAGTPKEGQSAGTDGIDGQAGSEGSIGLPGQPIQISVEDFDIDF